MNPTCKSRLKDLEEMQQFLNRQRNLSPEEQVESKLAHLQVFVLQMENTSSGQTELRSRSKRRYTCTSSPWTA